MSQTCAKSGNLGVLCCDGCKFDSKFFSSYRIPVSFLQVLVALLTYLDIMSKGRKDQFEDQLRDLQKDISNLSQKLSIPPSTINASRLSSRGKPKVC